MSKNHIRFELYSKYLYYIWYLQIYANEVVTSIFHRYSWTISDFVWMFVLFSISMNAINHIHIWIFISAPYARHTSMNDGNCNGCYLLPICHTIQCDKRIAADVWRTIISLTNTWLYRKLFNQFTESNFVNWQWWRKIVTVHSTNQFILMSKAKRCSVNNKYLIVEYSPKWNKKKKKNLKPNKIPFKANKRNKPMHSNRY